MSEQSKSTPTPKSAASKSTETASKPTETASKSTETASKPTETASKSTETASKSDTATVSDSTSSTTDKSEGGKSSRESIGGASAVHYGFFSNVKTPQYRSGWDDIWSKETEQKKKMPARAKKPVAISLALDELPEEVQRGLADALRAQLKKSRINYDKQALAGAVTWRIDCEVKR